MSRCSSANTFRGSGVPSGVCTVARRSAALRRVGLKLRTPSRASVAFIRFTMRVRSPTRHSRSRFGRLASSSAIVGTRAILQWPRSPRSHPKNPRDFASMDFPTRNLYRSAIEGLARGSKLSELEITRATLTAAADPKHKACREDNGVDSRERDPGYYLIGGGRPTFERTVGFRAPMRRWLVRRSTKIGIAGYIG